MPIRNVVTRGYGNGTFSPGVSRVTTRGYSVGEAIAIVITGLLEYTVPFGLADHTVPFGLSDHTVPHSAPDYTVSIDR